MNKTRQRLIILSDIWAANQMPQWINAYESNLNGIFDIRYYNICELGNIDTSYIGSVDMEQIDFGEARAEKLFYDGGLERALQALLKTESEEEVTILAFGLGGKLAWKAALNGLNISAMFLISSNSLKYEEIKPDCHISLYYAEHDDEKPDSVWYEGMGLQYFNILGEMQYMYNGAQFTEMLCDDLLNFAYDTIDNHKIISPENTSEMNLFDRKTAKKKAILSQFPIPTDN